MLQLIVWRRALPGNQVVSELGKKFVGFIERGGSLQSSQQLANRTLPGPY
jgi:hypothetical protein